MFSPDRHEMMPSVARKDDVEQGRRRTLPGREVSYEHDETSGLLVRRRFPEHDGASVHDFTRWDHDSSANAQHTETVVAIQGGSDPERTRSGMRSGVHGSRAC
jgi:hypothetical protein